MLLSTRTKMRLGRVLSHLVVGARAAVGRDAIIETSRHGVNWQLDLTEGIDLAIYLGLYQTISTSVLDACVPSGTLVIDIGANIGAHSLPLARRVGPQGRVVAVEPTDYAFAKLCANAAMNSDLLDRLIPVQAALGNGGKAQNAFYARWPMAGDGPRHPLHLGRAEAAHSARFLSLDTLLAELRFSGRIRGPVAFIKLDVDGHELEVLQGARRTFREDLPALLIEIAPYVQDEVPQRFEALLATLADYGYRFRDQDNGLPMKGDVLRAMMGPGGGFDVLALPALFPTNRASPEP
jgi:FkbM family methyltransferase